MASAQPWRCTAKTTLTHESTGLDAQSGDPSALQRRFSEQQTAILNALPAHVALLDKSGCLIEVNDAWREFGDANLTQDPNYGLGRNYLEVCDLTVGPEARDAASVAEGIRAILRGQISSFVLEYPCHAPCEQRWFRMMVAPIDAGFRHGAVVMHIDITERKLSEMDLQRAASVFTASSEGVVITDKQQVIRDVNPAYSGITGYSKEEVLGCRARFFTNILKDEALDRDFRRAMSSTGRWQGVLQSRRKSGASYIEQLSVSLIRSDDGEIINYILVFSDITAISAHQAELDRVAHYDALTNLPNRRLLMDRLQQAIRQAKRDQQALVVCYLDLDDFKPINDRLGHASGDLVLIELAGRLQNALREVDTVSRIGGDEFVLLLPGALLGKALDLLLDRLMKAMREPCFINSEKVMVSASMGVVLFPDDDVDADTLLRHADQAMYMAKESGRDRYHVYDAILARKSAERISKLQQIRDALLRNEFVLHYQPKVNLRGGTIVGLEALVRWQHPLNGLLSPAEFLDVVIGSEIEIEFGQYVLEQALSQLDAWYELGLNLNVSINVSGNELRQPELAEKIAAALARHPALRASQLEIEVLETAAMLDISQVISSLNTCRRLGVQVSLDDFGTGYSSLTILRRLPVDILKIDQSFVRNMLRDGDDFNIVESVIRMAQTFNRKVMAEGVETMEHAQALLDLGCELVQGYAIARPMPAADLPAWLDHWQSGRAWEALTDNVEG